MLDSPFNSVQSVREKIKQRRAQMLVHSYIYYELDDSIVTDQQWQAWANELRDLQAVFGHTIGWQDGAFKGWDGSTGFQLPKDEWAAKKALRLIAYRDRP